jgi:GntR family transcriptional regulator
MLRPDQPRERFTSNMSGRRPRYVEVAEQLRSGIASGRLSPGQQLPTERALMEQHDISVTVARAAIAKLRGEGLIESRQGKGSFVRGERELVRYANRYVRSQVPIKQEEVGLRGWQDKVSSDHRVISADLEIAQRLQIAAGELVSRVVYRWYVGHELLQVSTQYEPMSITKGTSIEMPSAEPGSPDVITRFDLIGMQVTKVEEHIRARMPKPGEAHTLSLPEGVPVIEIERTHYADALPVETAEILIRADRVQRTSEYRVSSRIAP